MRFLWIFSLLTLCSQLLDASIFQTKSDLAPLKKEIQKVLEPFESEAKVGIEIINLNTNEVVFEKNANRRLIPADLVKLFTAATAFDVMGPSFCFETKLVSSGEIEGGVLKGDLCFVGSGDPSLNDHDIDDLIFQLTMLNVSHIEGNIVFDSSEFDELPLGPGWMWDKKLEYRNASVDALTVNNSAVKVWVKPTESLGASPLVYMTPDVPNIQIENTATMSSMSDFSLDVKRKSILEEDVIEVSGKLPLRSDTSTYSVPVANPKLYVATLFLEKLKKNKLTFSGKVRFEEASTHPKTLASQKSDPLFKLVMYMLKNSNDLYANCLLKKVGRHKYGKPGTWAAGSQCVREFLQKIHSEVFSDVVVLDGSGESTLNQVSPHQINSFLGWITQNYIYSPEFEASLPIAGVDATLSKRLREKSLKAKVRALGGTLDEVSSICGLVLNRERETFAFTIMCNGYKKSSKDLKGKLEDRICYLLAQHSKGQYGF